MAPELFTIGHSNHSLPRFMALLGMHAIELVCDVRSTPYSRFNPQFNRETLQAALKAGGMDYLYLGSALGGKPRDRGRGTGTATGSEGTRDRGAVTEIAVGFRCRTRGTGSGATGSGYPTEEAARFALIAKSDRFRAGLELLLKEARRRRTAMMCAEQDPARCHRGLLICPSLPAEVTVRHILSDGSLRQGLDAGTRTPSDDHGQPALF